MVIFDTWYYMPEHWDVQKLVLRHNRMVVAEVKGRGTYGLMHRKVSVLQKWKVLETVGSDGFTYAILLTYSSEVLVFFPYTLAGSKHWVVAILGGPSFRNMIKKYVVNESQGTAQTVRTYRLVEQCDGVSDGVEKWLPPNVWDLCSNSLVASLDMGGG